MTGGGAAEAEISLDGPIDVGRSLRFSRMGPYDPSAKAAGPRFAKAVQTPAGPGTLFVEALGAEQRRVRVRAWGPGAAWLIAEAPRAVGAHDAPGALVAHDRFVAHLVAASPGLRLGVAPSLFETAVTVVLQQRVSWREAARAWVALVRRFGTPAPGPVQLVVPPPPSVFARLPPHVLEPLGVERRRADTIRRLAALAPRLEALRDAPHPEAHAVLAGIDGVGPWTVGMVAGLGLGDPDAVPLGDLHLPNMVAWALAREPRADDPRMLALLAPYAGQRHRVLRLLLGAAVSAPRRGPRLVPSRWLER